MKALFTLVSVLTFLIVGNLFAQTGVSINDDGTAPDAQSLLDLNVNAPSGANRLKGVLLPRMSTTDRDHVTYGVNPGVGDVGLMIYNTTTSTYQYWDGSMWVDVGTGTGNASTLDEAYDGGGLGLGRTIDADAGNVEIQGVGHLTVAANVGVGTTTPAAKLEVQFSGVGGILLDGDDTGDARIQLENGGGTHAIFDDQSDNNNLKLESASGRSIAFNTDGSNERMVVQSDGRLRVNNLADPNGAVITSNPAGVLGKTPLTAGSNDVLIGTGVFTDANNLNITEAGGWTDDGAVVRLTTVSDNVGIGTASPTERLSINGSNTDTNPILGLRSGNDNTGFNNGAQIAFGYNGTNTYQHFVQTRHNTSNSQNAIDFYVSDGTQNNTVTSGSLHTLSLVSGNAGVGTTAPAQKLHVQGTGRFSTLAGSGSRVIYANNNGDLTISSSNANPNNLIDGTGTTNYLARWTDSNTLGIGTTYDNGTNVGINTTSPGERLHVSGNIRVGGGTNAINSEDDDIRFHYGVRADDTSYEWVGFYSGTTRQGIILYDGSWSGANSSTDEFSITAENGNKLTLNTDGDHIALMPDGTGNVGIGTLSPTAKLQVDAGTNTEVRVVSDDSGASTLSAYGSSQGTGVLYVGQSSTYGGGIEYNGDGSPATTGAGADYVTLYRREAGTDNWTARNRYNNNDWQFREDVDVEGYLTVGNPTTGSTTRYGSETFFMTSSMSLSSGYSNSASLGTLTVPAGAANFTVTKVVYSFTGYHDDGDEQHGAMVRIGSTDFGSVFEVGSDGYTDVTWNNTSNHSTSFSSTQNVYFRLYDENDNCLFCSNNTFYVLNANITVYYSYSVGAQTGDVLAAGTVYSKNVHSTNTIGDVAEYFNVKTEAGQMPQVGQLVSFVAGSETEFKLSDSPYDNLIAGVISENPSVVLNKPNDGAPIALTGRVKVQLVESDKLVNSGDFITSSGQSGLGMRATTAGPVIGYAISNQKSGENTVEVLLQPGRFYFPKKELEKSEPENTKRKPGMSSAPR